MKLINDLVKVTALAGIALASVSSAPPTYAAIRPLTCGGGTASYFQDNDKQIGFARSNTMMRVTTPGVPRISAGMDVDALPAGSKNTFRDLQFIYRDDGQSVNNTAVRFCFLHPVTRKTITIEKPLASFQKSSVVFNGFRIAGVNRVDFNNEDVRQEKVILTRFTVVLDSANSDQRLDLGEILVQTGVNPLYRPGTIETRDVGCDALDDCGHPAKEVRKNLLRDRIESKKANRQTR